ncbi:MAG TPA: CdaR family protein, partial [Bacilli bacterium]|nr:CdaR family protein [Bacilli bacterium]
MKIKRTFRIIKLFFKKLYNLFDKKVILPITKFFVNISSRFKINGYGFEKIISRKNGLVVIALLVSVLIFVFVDTRSTSLAETSAEVIYNQPIKAIYNDAAYVIEGLPETVDITLIGTRSELYLAKQLPMNDIEVDLRDLKPGVHKVNLKYKKATSAVDYKLDPSTATVIVYDKVSESKLINTEIINKDKIDSKLIIDDVKLERDQVYIKGNDEKIDQVASVKALVNLANIVNQAAGEQILKDIKLVAYDDNGEVVDIEIVPSKIDA